MKYALVTVSDSLVNTSMPYNEFAVYLYYNNKTYKQYS